MKHTGKRVNLAIFFTMAGLFLGCALTVLLRDAYRIRSQMMAETGRITAEAVARTEAVYDTLGEDASRREQLIAYQQAMADNDTGRWGPLAAQQTVMDDDTGDAAAYPFRCVSLVTGYQAGEWKVPVRSRNMIFLTVTWEDGTEEQLPLAFAQENSADVAQLLREPGQLIGAMEGCYLELTGWWEDEFFYVQKLDTGDWGVSYESPLEPPGKTETIYIKTGRGGKYGGRTYPVSAASCGIQVSMKSRGGSGSRGAYASQWQEDDVLLERLISGEYEWNSDYQSMKLSGEVGTLVQDRSLTRCCVIARARLANRHSQLLSSRTPLFFVCAAEFSPMGLAARQLISGWMLPAMLLLFALLGMLLNTVYSYARQQELRQYRDEVTRQARALEYAQNAEKSRREMTSAIAHELKTPIAVLSSYAEALQENIDAEKQSHYLSVIREETGRMDRMVLELLDLSRLEAGRYKLDRESFDLEELFREILNPLRHEIEEKRLNILWQTERTEVNADRGRLGQVIENFMTNAIRHTPEGGKIVLRLGMEGETFSVENQGKPIPQEQLPKVWETFWQGDASRSERGSGLGLAICRTIVSLHGGSCRAENTAAGVKFSVSLSEKQRLYQPGRMPREECVRIDYPIARWYTTLDRVMGRLELLSGRALERELQAGNLRIGDEPARDRKAKLYPGYTVGWREFRITICQNDGEKRRAMLIDRMRVGSLGYLDGTRPAGWVGNSK